MELKIWCAYCKQEQDESLGYICTNCNERISYNHNMFTFPYDFHFCDPVREELEEDLENLFINRVIEIDSLSYTEYHLECKDNNPYSILFEAEWYFDSDYDEIDLQLEHEQIALNNYLMLYDKGFDNPAVLYGLFFCYSRAKALPLDLHKAYYYLSLLEGEEMSFVDFTLADEYCNGVYLEKNIEKAKELYRRCNNNYSLAKLYLLDNDEETLKELLDRETNSRFNERETSCFSDNRFLIIRSVSEFNPDRFNNILKAAEDGILLAMMVVAEYYEIGHSVKDLSKSFYWYKRCALRGDRFSMKKTADMYLLGKGVRKNKEEALNFYELALKYKERKFKYKNKYIKRTNITDLEFID
ncbi:MAG: hypothetical protein R3Y05_05530 [bacterium]